MSDMPISAGEADPWVPGLNDPSFGASIQEPSVNRRVRDADLADERSLAALAMAGAGGGAGVGFALGGPPGAAIGGGLGTLAGAINALMWRNRNQAAERSETPPTGSQRARDSWEGGPQLQSMQRQGQSQGSAGGPALTGDPNLDAIINQITQGGGEDDRYRPPEPQYLGLPPGVGLSGNGPRDSWENRLAPGAPRQRYHTNSPIEQFSRLPVEARLLIQEQLRRSGFNSVTATGRLDEDTLNAMTAIMGYANQNGQTWQAALNSWESDYRQSQQQGARAAWEQAKQGFIRDPYLAPSYETMAQDVKAVMRSRLGREPQEWEIELLSEELSDAARAAYDQQQSVAEYDYLARAAQGINREVGEDIIAAPTAPDGTAVDPSAAFLQKFDELYRNEIDAEEQEDIHADTSQRVISGLGGLDRLFQ